MGGENCTRRRSETSTRQLCTQCEEATPLLDYNDHILNGCAGCKPARHSWSHACHFPYGESTPYMRRHRDETYAFHASPCPLSEGRLPQMYMEEMLNHPRSGRTSTSGPIITLARPSNTHEFILDRGEEIHPLGCLLCHHNTSVGERFTRRSMYMRNLREHTGSYMELHTLNRLQLSLRRESMWAAEENLQTHQPPSTAPTDTARRMKSYATD